MTLRARLVLALVLLATVSVVAVGALSFTTTSHRLRSEIDASLDAYVDRFADPDLRSVNQACRAADRGEHDMERESGSVELPQALITCVDADGRVLATNLDDRVGSKPETPIVLTDEDHPRTQVLDGRKARVLAVRVADGREIRVGRSLTETDTVLDSLRNQVLLVGALVIAAAAVVGWFVARATAAPVVRLTKAAEHVTATGDLATPVPATGSDEVGRLARAFTAMLAQLRRSSDLQQQLVQDAGHELRTPLTSLRANVDTLRRHPDLTGDSRDSLLGDLDSETRELTNLVDELVALASDRYDGEPDQVVRLDEVAHDAADRAARRSGRAVDVVAEPSPVVGQPGQLQRAVGNLVENALKFSPPESAVEVRVVPGSLTVRDHGGGIAAEDLPHVFDRFYRAVGARDLPGSGLGLSIVRQVAERSGGSVTAADHPDGGAVFTLRIPPAADPGGSGS